MRKLMLGKMTVILATCLLGNLASATSLTTVGIRGSDHDFARFLLSKPGTVRTSTDATTGTVTSTTGTPTPLDEICIFCHAPHKNGPGQDGTDADPKDAPLWNHLLTTATFTPYTSATMKAVPGQPNGTSKLCLSCHDGTIALEAYGKTTTGTHFISDSTFGTGSKVIGTDLTNDHPISFVFDTALATADGELNDPATAPILSGAAGSHSMVGNLSDLLDRNGQVQCTSCHDPHNGQGINKLLKVNNTGSLLCLTCHNK